MNWDQFEGKWKQVKGSAREKWGKLTEDDIDRISGQKEQLVGLVQERYGIAREAAEKQADEWWRTVDEQQRASKKSTAHSAHR